MEAVKISGGNKWEKALSKYKHPYLVRAGILEGSTNGQTGELIAPYAAANEYGTADIPSRPFMRTTVAGNGRTWAKNFAQLIRMKRPIPQAMELIGTRIVEDIQATIKSSMPPPNSPETLKRKHAATAGKCTLIDTGAMFTAIDYEVES